jgi:ribonucleoside-triphosphate reductase
VGHSEDVVACLEHQDQLQPLYTGGTVFHTFLGESVADVESLREFIVKSFRNTKLPFLSITPTFSVCRDHGYIHGEHETCPTCGEAAEVYTRIVGYYRPVSRWNKGKQAEYVDRVTYAGLCGCGR